MKWDLVFLCFLFLFLGCDKDEEPGSFEAEQHSSEIIFIDGQIQLDIINNNGNINVIASDTASHIYLDIIKVATSTVNQGDADAHLNDIQIELNAVGDIAYAVVEHPEDNAVDYSVDFNIITPVNFDYDLILGNGNIDVQSISRKIVIELGNGNCTADVVLTNDCFMKVTLGNGKMMVTIPNATNAYISAIVGNGIITNGGLSIDVDEFSKTKLFGTLGNGDGAINLTLGHGDIELLPK